MKKKQQEMEGKNKKKRFVELIREMIVKKQKKEQFKIEEELLSGLDGISPNMIMNWKDIHFEENIDSGGSGTIFKGRYKYLNVAIKKINIKFLSLRNLRNVLSELLILDRLKHPNIILVLGFALDDQNNLFIVSELYPEKNFRCFLENNSVSLEKRVRILFEVATALSFLHSMVPPIIHRDIKPENIFITSSHQGVIGDFGIAKELEFTL